MFASRFKPGTAFGIALFALGVGGLARSVSAETPFVSETVDATGENRWTSLALDAQGNPHISYYDGDLEYAFKSGGNWTYETVDVPGVAGSYTSLALDAQGNPHISYYDYTNGDLKYAFKSQGSWTIEAVDTAGVVGEHTSLALDAQGNPHISYHDVTNTELKYAYKSGGSWIIRSLSSGGTYTSLALEPNGNVHISFLDGAGSLKYVLRGQNGALDETVDNSASLFTSLAVDARGNPHISYYDNTLDDLKYAFKSSVGGWTIEEVDAVGDVGEFPSLTLDGQGYPHISYFDVTNGVLKYVAKTEAGWGTPESLGQSGTHISLVLDSQGNPKISYWSSYPLYELRYADAAVHLTSPVGGEQWSAGGQETVTWRGLGFVDLLVSQDAGATYVTLLSSVSGGSAVVSVPTWSTQNARLKIVRSSPYSTSESPGLFSIDADQVNPWWMTSVDLVGDVDQPISLAVDRRGAAHFSYYDDTTLDLKYAVRSGGSWITETVDATGDVGRYSSLELDSQGVPHVSYFDNTNFDLKYAFKSGGIWAIETVAATGNVGHYPSLALDDRGNPHISYYDDSIYRLRYAVKTGGSWNIETVDPALWVGEFTSIGVDAQGNPHVSYFDSGDFDLKYAVKTGGSWTIETVDATGDVGQYTSLDLDAQGNPHVTYYDFSNRDLKYAVKTGGSWATETVDAAGEVGQYSSLRLDAQGNPHVSYFDDYPNYDLKYAVKTGGSWTIETVDATGSVGSYSSLALDRQGNPRIGYRDGFTGNLKYASTAVEITDPDGGASWPVGATRAISWEGAGGVDVWLSVDGGKFYDLLASGVSDGAYSLIVPHTPSRFCMIRLERRKEENTFGDWCYSHSVSESDSFFTIETSISLLSITVAPAEEDGGNIVSWNTQPGPADLSGYRLERRDGSVGWLTLVSLTEKTSHHDREGSPGDRYRLFAVNGLGEELYLGETSDGSVPSFGGRLAVWPIPFRGGELNISFPTGGPLGVAVRSEVAIYDVAGRRIQKVMSGTFPLGFRRVTWDGHDDSGNRVASGIYFVRLTSEGMAPQTRKLVIVR